MTRYECSKCNYSRTLDLVGISGEYHSLDCTGTMMPLEEIDFMAKVEDWKNNEVALEILGDAGKKGYAGGKT